MIVSSLNGRDNTPQITSPGRHGDPGMESLPSGPRKSNTANGVSQSLTECGPTQRAGRFALNQVTRAKGFSAEAAKERALRMLRLRTRARHIKRFMEVEVQQV
jgi:hypothetical protein